MKSTKSVKHFLTFFLILLSVVAGHSANAASSTLAISSKDVKVAVEAFFSDAPQMISIAKCESSFQQYTPKGATFTGAGGQYVGVFQIAKGHVKNATKLGFDIYTLEGNLGYAKYLYNLQGVGPWKGCVKPLSLAQKSIVTPPTTEKQTTKKSTLLTKNMRVGAKNSEVVTLQKILNAAGFFVAHSGQGSPGHETDTFSSKTREALKRFQCTKNIACKGTESTTGYGYVGPTTRAALLKEAKKQGL